MRKFPFLFVLVAFFIASCENESIDQSIYNQETTEDTDENNEDDGGDVILNGDI